MQTFYSYLSTKYQNKLNPTNKETSNGTAKRIQHNTKPQRKTEHKTVG